MATVARTKVVDDLDGSDGAKTIRFSIARAQYEIDLSPENVDGLYEALAPFITKSRRVPARLVQARADQSAVREWARKQGIEVSARGRMRKGLEAQYREAHQ
ncbi:histone-like nucleoid-structuring protein Lsr2 [Rhodococcus sp. NPDC055024]